MDVRNIQGAAGSLPAIGPKAAGGSGDGSFGDVFKKLVEEANETANSSDKLVEQMAKGEPTDVHQVMMAMTEADLSFRMLLEVRNKLVDAYQEIQRMPV